MRYHLRSDRINPQCVTIRHFMCLLPFCLHSMCIDCDSALYVRLSPSCLHLMCALVCPTGHQTPSLTVSHTIFKAVGIETRVTRTHTRSDTSCLTAIANENIRLTRRLHLPRRHHLCPCRHLVHRAQHASTLTLRTETNSHSCHPIKQNCRTNNPFLHRRTTHTNHEGRSLGARF